MKPLITKIMVLAVLVAGILTVPDRSASAKPFPVRFVVPPPHLIFPIPDVDIVYYPSPDADLFFADGFWFMPWDGAWYRSLDTAGPWVRVDFVPPWLRTLAPDFRTRYTGYNGVEFRMWHDSWRHGKHRSYHHRSDPAPRHDMRRSDPAPRHDMRRSDPAPRHDMRRSDPAPRHDMHRSDPAPRHDMRRSDPTPRKDNKRKKDKEDRRSKGGYGKDHGRSGSHRH